MRAPAFGLVLVATFAVATAANGLYNGAVDLPQAPNDLATIVALLNLLMGITGIASAVLVWRQSTRAPVPLLVWGASAIGASLLAPRAYAPEVGWPAAILGGVATSAIVAAIVLYVRWRLALRAAGESSPVS